MANLRETYEKLKTDKDFYIARSIAQKPDNDKERAKNLEFENAHGLKPIKALGASIARVQYMRPLYQLVADFEASSEMPDSKMERALLDVTRRPLGSLQKNHLDLARKMFHDTADHIRRLIEEYKSKPDKFWSLKAGRAETRPTGLFDAGNAWHDVLNRIAEAIQQLK